MERNCTPAPWLGISANGGGVTIRIEGNKWVKAAPADVAAMKAAPDLLNALANLLELAGGWIEGRSDEHDSCLDEAKAAIAKATAI